jgi:hypothetical protein
MRRRLNCLISARGAIEMPAKKHNYGAPSVGPPTQYEINSLDRCNLWIFSVTSDHLCGVMAGLVRPSTSENRRERRGCPRQPPDQVRGRA